MAVGCMAMPSLGCFMPLNLSLITTIMRLVRECECSKMLGGSGQVATAMLNIRDVHHV